MWLFILNLLYGCADGDVYSEELKITRLSAGNMMATFRFTITSENLLLGYASNCASTFSFPNTIAITATNSKRLYNVAHLHTRKTAWGSPNHTLFPRILSEMISAHSVSELSFFITQGRWHTSRWGTPPQPNGPTGAAVHAWLTGNETEVDRRWRTLINSLNGLLCTAMTSVVPDLTSSPKLAFKRKGSDCGQEMHVYYSAVGRESVCTENLTPWKKLLPCKQHGLVTLLNPLKLYESVYHVMGLELYPWHDDHYGLEYATWAKHAASGKSLEIYESAWGILYDYGHN